MTPEEFKADKEAKAKAAAAKEKALKDKKASEAQEQVDIAAKKKAAEENLAPLEYMRKYGAFEVEETSYEKNRFPLSDSQLEDTKLNSDGQIVKNGKIIGVQDGEIAVEGFPTPSKKQEFYSNTMAEWKWEEFTIPKYIKSHIHPENLDRSKNEFVLVSTFRLPTLIHSRSGNAKWLVEIAHRNPIWIHPSTAEKVGVNRNSRRRVEGGR